MSLGIGKSQFPEMVGVTGMNMPGDVAEVNTDTSNSRTNTGRPISVSVCIGYCMDIFTP